MPQRDRAPTFMADPSRPWLPLHLLRLDEATVELLLPVGDSFEVVKGHRSAVRFAGHITWWARIDGRLQLVRPSWWRECESRGAARVRPNDQPQEAAA